MKITIVIERLKRAELDLVSFASGNTDASSRRRAESAVETFKQIRQDLIEMEIDIKRELNRDKDRTAELKFQSFMDDSE